MAVFHTLSNGATLEFVRGRFDDWCLVITTPNQISKAPKDSDYFQELQRLSSIFGGERLYQDFVKIYNNTNRERSSKTIDLIKSISQTYQKFETEVETIFFILYATMIAEENKQRSRLKKRIKRLGVHQVLMENLKPHIAARYSRGMSWQEIDKECQQRGF